MPARLTVCEINVVPHSLPSPALLTECVRERNESPILRPFPSFPIYHTSYVIHCPIIHPTIRPRARYALPGLTKVGLSALFGKTHRLIVYHTSHVIRHASYIIRHTSHVNHHLLVFPLEPRDLPLRVPARVRLDVRDGLLQRAFAVEVVE